MAEKIPSHSFFDKEPIEEERPVVNPGDKPLETQEKQTAEHEFRAGDIVKIKGSNQRWQIYRIDQATGKAQLEREDFNLSEHTAMASKLTPIENLEKVIEPNFEGAKNFEDLYAEIDRVGGVQGSSKFYAPNELKERIEAARKNPLEVESITGGNGLRDRVIALIQEEIANGNNPRRS